MTTNEAKTISPFTILSIANVARRLNGASLASYLNNIGDSKIVSSVLERIENRGDSQEWVESNFTVLCGLNYEY